eukprot:Colp12_sorted_trinity150504_noHs@11603
MLSHFIFSQTISLRGAFICNTCLSIRNGIFSRSMKSEIKFKNGSSHEWFRRQERDPFRMQALENHYRCRSAYKLIQIDEKYKIFKKGFRVVDLGARPGSWTQVAVQRVNSNPTEGSLGRTGFVVSVDIEDFQAVEGATILPQCDITHPTTHLRIRDALGGRRAHVVMSDMAPNASGSSTADHLRLMNLLSSAVDLAVDVLERNGSFVCKLLSGAKERDLWALLRQHFTKVSNFKPKASHSNSSEYYIVAVGFKGKGPKASSSRGEGLEEEGGEREMAPDGAHS